MPGSVPAWRVLDPLVFEDVVIRAMQLDAEMLIFDRNLRPAQASSIARMTDLKVIDRTQLILDIFAQQVQQFDNIN